MPCHSELEMVFPVTVQSLQSEISTMPFKLSSEVLPVTAAEITPINTIPPGVPPTRGSGRLLFASQLETMRLLPSKNDKPPLLHSRARLFKTFAPLHSRRSSPIPVQFWKVQPDTSRFVTLTN